jgi:hypothetical protein
VAGAVSGFVDGFFKGRDWRDNKEDRTLDRERQGRLDEINEGRYGLAQNADARAQGNYGRQVEEYDYLVGERERQNDLDEQERQAQASWAESMSLGVTPPPQNGENRNFPVYGNETPAGADPSAQPYTPAPARPDLSFGQLGVSQNSPTPQQDASRFKTARDQKSAPNSAGAAPNTSPRPQARPQQAPDMAMLEGDATLQLMAGRAQMSVPEYFASLAPEAQAQHLARLTPADVATDTAANQSYGEQSREDTFRGGNASEDARAAAIANAKAGPTANQNFPTSFGIEPVAPAPQDAPNIANTPAQMETRSPHDPNARPAPPYGNQSFPSSFGQQAQAPTQQAPETAATPSAAPVRPVNPNSSAFGQDVQGVMRENDIQKGLSQIAVGLAGEGSSPVGRAYGAVSDYFTATPAEGAENSQARATTKEAQEWYQSVPALEFFRENPNMLDAAGQDPVAFYTEMANQNRPETPPAEGDQSNEATNKQESAAAASEAPAVQADAEQGVAIARDVALSYGLKPGEDVTSAQTDRGSQAYVDRYYETVVPQAIEFYIGRGEMDKAQAYIELVESREGKAALRDIGRSTFSMMTGDVDAAAEHALSAFKQYGYVDPNMEVDLEATGLFNDDDGNPGGARIVLLNKDTGERTEQTFATADEYLKYVHMMVSPATVAEMLFNNQPEQRGAITQQDVMKGASDIMAADLSGETTMPQAIQQYMQGVQSLGRLGGGGGAQQEAPLFRLGN